MPGTGGVRKLRWVDPATGKGKHGGLRVIYYFISEATQIWLFTLYGKDKADDLTATEKAQLRTAVTTELEARRDAVARRRRK